MRCKGSEPEGRRTTGIDGRSGYSPLDFVLNREQRRSRRSKIAALFVALLLASCGEEPEHLRKESAETLDRVDSCDMRRLFGNCVEYTLSELHDNYRKIVEGACRSNRRGNLFGVYRISTRCPAENRVARCEDMIEDSSERLEYDKHYYRGMAEGFSWEPENVRETCEYMSGHFVPE